jgi:hypothetical protein
MGVFQIGGSQKTLDTDFHWSYFESVFFRAFSV